MKIDICDIVHLIELNNLKEVTSPRLFSNKMMYDPDGILSTEIFGINKGDRRNTFAYIDLKRHFIHPHIYAKVLKGGMCKDIIYILSGQRRFSIRDGLIVRDDENGWTGIDAFYSHYDEIRWDKFKSGNKTNNELMKGMTKEKFFTDKILVVPPAYRDVILAGTVDSSDHVNELNDLYVKLIRSVSRLSEGGLFSRTQYASQMVIQDTLVDIMNYFKKQISRKQGLIKKYLIGKSVTYGVRSVISSGTYNHNRFEDNMIDVNTSAVPISICCSTFYPFIESWVKNFFTREIINDPNSIVFYDPKTNKEIRGHIENADVQFSEKMIKKIINNYLMNPDNRFTPIYVDISVPMEDGDKIIKGVIGLKGKIINDNNSTSVLNRAMTYTDLLYLACVDVCEKRHVMVSRYPVGTDKGIYFNRIRVQSTIKHIKVVFNGREYPFYPVIDFNVPHEKVGICFIDTLVMENSHLDGMGADYDGDQVSIRGIWSDEANAECEDIMNSKMSALNITGTNAKVVAKEVFNSLYELTKVMSGGKILTPIEQKKYLDMSVDGFTLLELTDMFADFVNNSDGKNKSGKTKSKYNTWDRITIPKNYFYDGQSEVETTIGRFVANKFILQGSGVIGATKIMDNVWNKSYIGSLDNLIGQLYMEDVIDREAFNKYTERRDTLGYWLNGMLAHTISERMLKPLPEIQKKKQELCKKYEKELSEGNIDVMTQIADELVAYAKEILKDDPGMDLYLSGDLDFGNNYKNNSIIKGAVMNKITNEFDFISTSFMDGIDIKDIPAHANSILASQYPASIATADAGYLGKKILALLQMMEVDEDGTDCGTKILVPVKVTKYNKDNLVYSYINNDAGQLEMLTKDNIKGYVGKTVKMRSPMTCKNDKICSKCAGKLFYLLGIKNAGLFGVQISHADLNLGLKAKHNSLISLYTLDPNELIRDIV